MNAVNQRQVGARRAALILFPVALFLFMLFLFHPFLIDDTYITFRYASNLAAGGAISFNADDEDPVDGYTSFSWMLLAAGAIRAGLDPLGVARAVGVLSGIGSLLLLYQLGLTLLRDPRIAVVPPLILAASIELAMWTLSGMETTFLPFSCFSR